MHTHKHQACSRENKGHSSSEREKVSSSSADEKSFVIEGIKHFLSTSCSLSPTHHRHPSTLPPLLPLIASLFSLYRANFPSPAPMLTLSSSQANTQLTFTRQRSAATSNVHIAYTLSLSLTHKNTHTHKMLWLIAKHLARVLWKGNWRSVQLEGKEDRLS